MPRVMTMNGDHHSVAAAPLDLRTTHRERVRDARTAADSSEKNGASTPGSHGGASRKRLVDTSSLPLRKRPFPVQPESRSQSLVVEPSAQQIPPAEQHQRRFDLEADAGWLVPASATPRRAEDAPAFPIIFPSHFVCKSPPNRAEISHLSNIRLLFKTRSLS